jgi:hypothetical protein
MMDHNPYSPPQTEVREPINPDDAGPRPRQVTWAVQCFWVELALGVPQTALQIANGQIRQYIVATLILIGVISASEALVIYKISTRSNWARYVALVCTVLGTMIWISSARAAASSASIALNVIATLLDIAALYLLFTRPGKDWFKTRAGR